jgi:Brp/Blh family beta-carotene 15,15'-monooxygenase
MVNSKPLGILILAVLALVGFYGLERLWPHLSWVVFFALTLSLGFAHGVLDVVLIRHALPRQSSFGVYVLYGLSVLIVLAAARARPAAALVVLLLMSVWHFGQALHPLRAARVALGGAAVMWPMIVQPAQMQALLLQVFAQSPWLSLLWQMLAWGWLALLMVVLIVHWSAIKIRQRLLVESASLAVLYGLLTPWLAFALYFSLFHSVAHIYRVWWSSQMNGDQWLQHRMGLLATALLTLGLMLACLAMLASTNEWMAILHSAWTLPTWVALVTAVTVPHGLLVAKSWDWLSKERI